MVLMGYSIYLCDKGSGSRVALQLGAAVKHVHRPHPGKEAKKYRVEEIRAWSADQGKTP